MKANRQERDTGRKSMGIAKFGRVLIAMAEYTFERAELRREYLGTANTELLFAISHMLKTGAEKCIEIAEEDQNEVEEKTAGN